MAKSMELQSAQEAAALQDKVNEAKISHLQALLDAARKERDEARIKCRKLQDCLLDLSHPPRALVPVSAQESPCNLLQSSLSSSTSSPTQHSYPASPSIDVIRFQDPKQKRHVSVDEGALIFEGDVSAKLVPCQAQDVEDIFALDLHPDPSAITVEDSQQQFSMDILNDDVAMDEDESLDLSELQVEQPSKPTWDASLSSWDAHTLNGSSGAGHTLGRQTSCVSSAASQAFTPPLSHSPLLMASSSNAIIPDISGLGNKVDMSGIGNKALLSCVGTVQHQGTHLVEATECLVNQGLDNALPEKGKLLLAVMQAGPLLQNLLLAGPLPQWRRPPPQLNTLDIPRVPLAPCNFLPSPSLSTSTHHVPMMQSPFLTHALPNGHVNSAHFNDRRGRFLASSELQSNLVKNDRILSIGGRKLRKLSPVGVK